MTDTSSRPTATSSRSRKTRRSISLAPDPLADTPPAPPAPEPVAPPAKKTRARKPAAVAAEPPATTTKTAKPKPPATPKPPARAKLVEPKPPARAQPVEPESAAEVKVAHPPLNPDAKPGEEYPGEPVTKMTINIPLSLHRRASGLVAHAQFTGNPEGIRSLTDLVRDAINLAVTKAEVDLNDGDPFHPPAALRRGRRVTL